MTQTPQELVRWWCDALTTEQRAAFDFAVSRGIFAGVIRLGQTQPHLPAVRIGDWLHGIDASGLYTGGIALADTHRPGRHAIPTYLEAK